MGRKGGAPFFRFAFSFFFITNPPLHLNGAQSMHHHDENKGKKVALIGASIARDWKIESLPERLRNDDYAFEYVASGGFDKSPRLVEILGRANKKPAAVILKECAAYFPGDFASYQAMMTRWVRECRRADVIPIPATVIPVTRLHAYKKFAIDIVKFRNPFKPGVPFRQKRQKQILEYNDWIRLYCQQNGLPVCDLERAVRQSEKSRYLRTAFAKIDGLHLGKEGYAALDGAVMMTLKSIAWKTANKES